MMDNAKMNALANVYSSSLIASNSSSIDIRNAEAEQSVRSFLDLMKKLHDEEFIDYDDEF